VEFTILGRTTLRIDGQLIDLGTEKPRAVLALLLLHAGRPVTVDLIVDQLWPDRSPDEVRGNLQTLVSRLRNALKRAGLPEALPPSDTDAYRIELDPQLVDYHRFRWQAEAGRAAACRGDHATAARLLREAIDLWRGLPLGDLRTDWATRRRDLMVDGDLLPAHQSLIESELELAEYASALNRLGPLMDDHPLNETFARQRIRALDGLGRPAEVTSFYVMFRRRLRDRVGAEPGLELRKAYEDVLRRRAADGDRPPSTAGSARGQAGPWQLPRVVTNVTGREELLATLDALLLDPGTSQPAPVVALHGMPGVGKTTVAALWGWSRRNRFPGGSLFRDFHGYGPDEPVSAEDAMVTFLEALGVPAADIPSAGPQLADRLNRALAGRKVLVVLDNVRDLANVRPVLSATSTCPALVTCRAMPTGLVARDGVAGVTVHTLSMDDSVVLLRGDITDGRADDDPASVQALAASCGGLPVALRLMGPYAAHRPRARLADIARELDSCAALLAATGEEDEWDTPQGAFYLSFKALSPEAADLFRVLGLHPRPGFGRPAACALLGREIAETERQLKALTDAHLLEPEGSHRYRLHDLLQAYAADRARRDISGEQRHEAVERLVDFYCRTASAAARTLMPYSEPVPAVPTPTEATPLTFDTEDEALRWCMQERDNLIAATRLAAEYQLHEYAWRIPAAMGRVFERSGFEKDFLDSLYPAIESARTAGSREAEVGMLTHLGGSFFVRHDYRRALFHFQQALEVAQRTGDPSVLGPSLHNVGSAHLKLGNTDAAIRLYQQAIELERARGSSEGVASCLHQLGVAYRQAGRHEEALHHCHRALQLREEIKDARGQGDTLTELAALSHDRGQPDRAIALGMRALDMYERAQEKVKATRTLTVLATVHLDTGSLPDAADCAGRAIELCSETGDDIALAQALHILGRVHHAGADHEAASAAWTRAVRILDTAEHAEAEAVRERLEQLDAACGQVPRPRAYPDSGTEITGPPRLDSIT
jgi:DNA-binding SARP family transcriptional activator/tetratricopeptide (TPR) repeat protein